MDKKKEIKALETILTDIFGIVEGIMVIVVILTIAVVFLLIVLKFYDVLKKNLRDSSSAKNNTICCSNRYVLEGVVVDIRNFTPNIVRNSQNYRLQTTIKEV